MQQNWLKVEQLKAIAAIALSLIILAIAPIFIKLLEGEIGTNATIFNRLWGAAIIFGFWSGLSRIKSQKSNSSKETRKKDYLLLLLAGFLFWASQTSWAWSLPRTSVAISELLHNFTPIFVILGGWLVGRQRFNIQFLLGTALSIIGSCLIGIEHLSHSSDRIQGDLAALLSAAFLGGYMLVGETLCYKLSTVTIMFWVCTAGTVFSIPVLLIAGMQSFPESVQGWIFAVSLILTMVLGQGFFLYGVEPLGASLAAVLFLLLPAITEIAAWLVFSEILSYLDWGAMAIVLLGVYLAISTRSQPAPELKGEEEIASAN